ncbi:Bacterial regulatory protein, tetR family [Pseudovibrio axinellae]|uniref:Bacterial regulatory protein, tetR family n=1 Tax=Pseudovibrio axinellae TaxID=989403 RepID=A0A161V8W3_9HYPH|nr:TetR/AcrR family transcriptional regulator [Pseudovibrio axinellae]KZL21429.1 Bacterial regulatory protein, tetR family [Pseudovibrio axinellae]SER00012.1 transcriptional regulator, TetR family [Pseudovibrio axinellae]
MFTEPDQQDFTDRQRAVLDKALELLVEGGEKALTTAAIARAAGCSKESLYKWFGDRDGLLAAIVTRQASKVIPGADQAADMSEAELRAALEVFAKNLLETISGDVSLALNRLAIGQASKAETGLGAVLEKSGRARIGRQTTALLERGCTQGYLNCEDPQEAYSTLYGLVVRDQHIRMLLGASKKASVQDLELAAKNAVKQFIQLYGANK